jgi:cysteine desulfurase
MGFDVRTAGEVIRVSFGRTTRREDVWRFADQWRSIAADAKARVA